METLELLRILRQASYRCRYRHPGQAYCGNFASSVGLNIGSPSTTNMVALCETHAGVDPL